MAEKFDAIIIGTGQSGPALAARMTREGMKTAIIERKLFGGTCAFQHVSHAQIFGHLV